MVEKSLLLALIGILFEFLCDNILEPIIQLKLFIRKGSKIGVTFIPNKPTIEHNPQKTVQTKFLKSLSAMRRFKTYSTVCK